MNKLKSMKMKIKKKVKSFIKNKRGSSFFTDNAIVIIAVVVLGLFLVTKLLNFYDVQLLPALFDKIMSIFSLGN